MLLSTSSQIQCGPPEEGWAISKIPSPTCPFLVFWNNKKFHFTSSRLGIDRKRCGHEGTGMKDDCVTHTYPEGLPMFGVPAWDLESFMDFWGWKRPWCSCCLIFCRTRTKKKSPFSLLDTHNFCLVCRNWSFSQRLKMKNSLSCP